MCSSDLFPSHDRLVGLVCRFGWLAWYVSLIGFAWFVGSVVWFRWTAGLVGSVVWFRWSAGLVGWLNLLAGLACWFDWFNL